MERATTRCLPSVFLLLYVSLSLVARQTSAKLHFTNNTEQLEECNQILTKPLETIYSPDYPNASPLSKMCSWQIQSKPNKYVAVQLMEMKVGGLDWDCTKGYIEIYDGCGKDQFLVDKICTLRYENDQRYLWVSTGPCVVIKFNSAGGTMNKFYLKTREKHFSCNKVFHDQPNGTFSYPNFISLGQQECTWVLAVPRNRIEMKFLGDFQIQKNNGKCRDDRLTVQDGRFSSSSVLGTYCGHTRPYPVYSTYGDMRITLKSSGTTSGNGNIFKAVYSMSDMHGEPTTGTEFCKSSMVFKSSHNSFWSPGYPVQYPRDMNCVWLIEVKPGAKILLRFKDFDVEGDSEKCDDYVEIFDGLASWSPVKGRYCGRDIPPVIRSESNKLRLDFKSNSRYAGRGFDAVYSDYDPRAAKSTSSSGSHITGIMIGTTCGIIFIVLSVLAVFHARKRRLRRTMEQRADMASSISFDVHQANAPPSYETVMASPNLYPVPKGDPDITRAYDGVPSLHHEVCHLLGSNPDSDDEEPPPTYHGLFGNEGDVHAYGHQDGHLIVEYHRHASQEDQAGGMNDESEKPEKKSKSGRVWQRRDYDHSRSSLHLPGSRTETLERPKETGTRPTLERQDTSSTFVTDV